MDQGKPIHLGEIAESGRKLLDSRARSGIGPVAIVGVAVPVWLALCALNIFGAPLASKNYIPVDRFGSSLPLSAGDPPLGSPLPASVQNILGGKKKFVVYAECPSCSIRNTDLATRLATWPDVVIIDATGDPTYFKKLKDDLRATNIVFADPSVVGDLNVAFSPRYYEIGADSSITYIQPEPTENIEQRLRE